MHIAMMGAAHLLVPLLAVLAAAVALAVTSAHDIPGTQYANVHVPLANAADATALVAGWVAPFKCLITSLQFTASAAVTGANTNSRNLNVTLGDATEIANVDFAANSNAAKGTAKTIALTGTTAQKTLAAGAALFLESELVGAGGLALPMGVWRIGFRGL